MTDTIEELRPACIDDLRDEYQEPSSTNDPDPEYEDANVSQESIVQDDSFILSQGSSTPRFKKIKRLNEHFSISRDGKARRMTCKGCAEVYKTTDHYRLINHVQKCSKITQEDKRLVLLDYHATIESNRGYILLTKFFVACNISFRSVESLAFKELVDFLILCSSFKLPPRKLISESIVPLLSFKAADEFRSAATHKNNSLSIEFDHWKEGGGKELFGILATDLNGEKFLCNLEDVSLLGKTSRSIVDCLDRGLDDVPKNVINAISSDSASACKIAREVIVEKPEFKHVIQHRCAAHLLNRMGWYYEKNNDVATALKWAQEVYGFVSKSAALQAKVKEQCSRSVKRRTETRWYSTASMIDSILDAKDVIVEAATDLNDKEETDKWLKKVIVDDIYWHALERLKKIYFPLCKCIGKTEKANCSLGEVVNGLLKIGKALYFEDWNDPLFDSAARAYLVYFSTKKLDNGEFGLWLAAYLLNPKYRLRYLTQDAIDMALKSILEVALKNGVRSASSRRHLVSEFESYCSFEGDYASDPGSQKAYYWWNERRDSGSFQRVALRITNLKASTANIERTFSGLKYIQNSWRLQLTVDKMKDLMRLRLNDEFAQSDLIRGLENSNVNQTEDSWLEVDFREINDGEEPVSTISSTDIVDKRAPVIRNREMMRLYREHNRLIDFEKQPLTISERCVTDDVSIDDLIAESRHVRELRNIAQ